MKKITKLLALALALVMICTMLTACALVGTDLARYRSVVALTVGDEEVSVGVITDSYTSNLYNYYSYISAGYMTYDEVFEMTMSELYEKYSILDDYKKNNDAYTVNDNSYISLGVDNMEYLTEQESEYILSYIKYTIFTALDTYVEGYVTTEVGEMGTITEDTSRDFTEYDDLSGFDTYNEFAYSQVIDTETMDEYFTDYYSITSFSNFDLDIDTYIFASEADAAAKVDYINECLEEATEDGDEPLTITAEDYMEWQELAMEQFITSVDTNYGLTVDGYTIEQLGYSAISIILNKWSYGITSAIESDEDALVAALEEQFDSEYNAYITSLNQNPDSYISFVTSLSSGSYVYSIPELYENDFIFVKNTLITFSDAQSQLLSTMASILGGTDSDQYKEYRLSLVEDIVAIDYNDDEAEVEGLFTVETDGTITLNGDLAEQLDGNAVTDEQFMEVMAQYNADTASHTSAYDYVVYTGAPDSYTHSWVDEFVDAAIEAKTAGVGNYSICVSDYGVHIVYYSSDIVAWDSFDSTKLYDSTSNEYAMLVSYYTAQSNILYTAAGEALDEVYLYGGLIVESKGLGYILDNTGLEYDFDAATTEETDEDE